MIHFSLHCDNGHEFEGWFRDNADFDAQSKRGLVECPACASKTVGKSLMAPAVSTGRRKETMALAANAEQKRIMSEIRALADKMKDNADYVGDKFAQEARRIHFGEAEARGIYGEANVEDVKSLAEDGVPFLPIPVLPEDRN